MAGANRVAGHQFLQQRLKRAEKVPAADATADVRAFVESSRLLDQLCQLLPLADKPAPEPALPPGPDSARRMEGGLYCLALADALCPSTPVHGSRYLDHVGAFGVSRFVWGQAPDVVLSKVAAGGSSSSGRNSPRWGAGGQGSSRSPQTAQDSTAAQALHLLGAGILRKAIPSVAVQALPWLVAMTELLAAPAARERCQQQLRRIAAEHSLPQRLRAEDLLYAVHSRLATVAEEELDSRVRAAVLAEGPSRAQAVPLADTDMAALSASIHAMLQLGPDHPGSHVRAAKLAALRGERAAVFDSNSRAVQLARQQGSWYWVAQAGCRLATHLESSPPQDLEKVGGCE